ncbi:MAG: VWA-like domain-containing protein [Lachnospiraceae bacterium]|nr:VWA-like domain-containing protein [Lachnospiraceae bacterium]
MAKVLTQDEWEDDMSKQILGYVRNELYLELRFMDVALSELIWTNDESIDTMATDGQYLFYSHNQLIRTFKKNTKYLNRLYLHAVLHCIFSHLWTGGGRDRILWDIACDIMVEYTIDSLDKNCVKRPLSWLRQNVYNKIDSYDGTVSAAVIYSYLKNVYGEKLTELQREFYCDSHKHWPKEEKMTPSQQQIQNNWDKISRQSDMELERHGDDDGKGTNLIRKNIRTDKSRRSYKDFLRKFAVLREEMHCDPDEYDRNLYTYGLNVYGNMPIIEPLETREVMRIQEFVVVIDTSYSTSGELVKNFLKETFTILSEENSFFKKCRLHVIQCDDDVRSDIVISDRNELSRMINSFELMGGGNTDFRPAFRYVGELISNGELKNLKGLIYFTDGKGIYPKKRPPYKTVFVYVNDYEEQQVPPWAIRLKIESDMLVH